MNLTHFDLFLLIQNDFLYSPCHQLRQHYRQYAIGIKIMILTGYVKRIFIYGVPVFLFPSFIVVSAFETKSMAFSFD